MKRTLFALGLALASAAFAANVAGVDLPDTLLAGDSKLVLQGGALRSKMMLKVYVAGLYLPAKRVDAAAILAADEPRRMEMHFLRGVGSGKICEGWREGLAANTPGADAELERQFDQLCAWMPDAEAGTLIGLTYLPGQGTTVTVRGETRGTLAGKSFADALLSCWIGPVPGPGADFKRALLGG
ncbi:MAG: chalcone isomerase family protein [Thermoanaerobaculia bacterium]|nr:chalcone isomerase family protein [Thermoanaerobaculia bacterium]